MHRNEIKLLNIILSSLAAQWSKQRGEPFDFGDVGGEESKMNVSGEHGSREAENGPHQQS